MSTRELPSSRYWICDRSRQGGYRWVILFGSFMLQVTTSGSYTGTLFIEPIAKEFGLGRGVSSLMATLTFVMFSFFATLGGRATEYYGASWIIIVGSFITLVGFGVTAFSNDAGMVLFFFGLSGGGNALLYMASLAVLGDWFPDQLGLAYGLTLSGIGVGGSAFSFIVNALLEKGGWRLASGVLGIIEFILGCICATFVKMRNGSLMLQHRQSLAALKLADSAETTSPKGLTTSPSTTQLIPVTTEMSLSPLPSPTASPLPTPMTVEKNAHRSLISDSKRFSFPVAAPKKELEAPPLFQWSLFKEISFVYFMMSEAGVAFIYYAPYVHLAPFSQDLGLSPSHASTIVAVLNFTGLVGRLSFGLLCDRFHALWVYNTSLVGISISLVIWSFCNNYVALILLSAFAGIATGGSISTTTAGVRALVGKERASSALGLVYGIAWVPGSMLTGLLMGICKDKTGSYEISLYSLAVLGVLSTLLGCIAKRKSPVNDRGMLNTDVETDMRE